MASTIAAVTTSGGGVVTTADASGNLNLLAGTTTVVALTTAGAAITGTLSSTTGATFATSSGNVLIGTTSNAPGSRLVSVGGGIQLSGGTTAQAGVRVQVASGVATFTGINNDNNAYNPLAFYTSGTEAVRIDSSGNVGIGTASPSTYGKLAVSVGNNSFMGATTSSGSSGGAGGWQLNSYYGSVKINYIDCELTNGTPASETSVMRFATIGSGTLAERMRIDSSGQLILKRTAAVNSATLVCSAAQNTRAVSFVNNNNNNEVGYIFLNNDGTTTQYATTSDYRLKENVTPMLGALSVVAQLKPVTYKWKINGADGQGFIAHELQAVVPDCVTGEKDGVEIYTDVDGNEQTIPKHQGIDTSFLVATLTAAIQELKAIIDTQATRIAALEAK